LQSGGKGGNAKQTISSSPLALNRPPDAHDVLRNWRIRPLLCFSHVLKLHCESVKQFATWQANTAIPAQHK
jgi:hypothetical protein